MENEIDLIILGVNPKSDKMILPNHYEVINEPYYTGDGNHSVAQLEHLCNCYKEYCHQQGVIKQSFIEKIKELSNK